MDDFPETANIKNYDYTAPAIVRTPNKNNTIEMSPGKPSVVINQAGGARPGSSILEQVASLPPRRPDFYPKTPTPDRHSPPKEIEIQSLQQDPSRIYGGQSSQKQFTNSDSHSILRDNNPDNRLRQLL